LPEVFPFPLAHEQKKCFTLTLITMTAFQNNITAASIAEIELIYRSNVKPSERPRITTSHDAYLILRTLWSDDTICLYEQFRILLLDRSNRVLGQTLISSGGTAGTVVDPKLVFVTALKTKSAALIIAHNHPSGNLQPSEADLRMTRQLKQAGCWLELPILDHLIITEDSYYSMADEGVL
jgi:DNA repair protein RadC